MMTFYKVKQKWSHSCLFLIFLETERAVVPDVILEKILQQLKEKKPDDQGDPITDSKIQEFQIWDFAGQDVYYTTHQVC